MIVKKFIVALFVCIISNSYAYSQESKEPKKPKHTADELKIVVFGDSIISGFKIDEKYSFVETLERKYASKKIKGVEILNGVQNGQTTQKALERVDKVIAHEPHIVILAFGLNDAFKKISVKQIYTNLARIISKLKNRNIKILLLGVNLPKDAGVEYEKLPQMYGYLAKKYNIELYPNLLEGIIGDPKMSIEDRIHPNEKGMEAIVENTFSNLEKVVVLRYRDILLWQRRQTKNWTIPLE